MASAFAYNASLLALNEALGLGPSRSSKPYADEDENLPDTLRDTASAAVLAEAGAPWLDYSDPQKRLAFWEWWLLEALPASLA